MNTKIFLLSVMSVCITVWVLFSWAAEGVAWPKWVYNLKESPLYSLVAPKPLVTLLKLFWKEDLLYSLAWQFFFLSGPLLLTTLQA